VSGALPPPTWRQLAVTKRGRKRAWQCIVEQTKYQLQWPESTEVASGAFGLWINADIQS